MRIVLGADHGGFPLKKEIADLVRQLGHDPIDVGAHTLNPADDYPDFAHAVAEVVASGRADRGILICGSGVGAAMAANKIRRIRAGLCHDTYSARQGVEHDDLNVLCLGARVIGPELALELVRTFLAAQFSGEERHQRRLKKVLSFEQTS